MNHTQENKGHERTRRRAAIVRCVSQGAPLVQSFPSPTPSNTPNSCSWAGNTCLEGVPNHAPDDAPSPNPESHVPAPNQVLLTACCPGLPVPPPPPPASPPAPSPFPDSLSPLRPRSRWLLAGTSPPSLLPHPRELGLRSMPSWGKFVFSCAYAPAPHSPSRLPPAPPAPPPHLPYFQSPLWRDVFRPPSPPGSPASPPSPTPPPARPARPAISRRALLPRHCPGCSA
jgi:hypothetical protein